MSSGSGVLILGGSLGALALLGLAAAGGGSIAKGAQKAADVAKEAGSEIDDWIGTLLRKTSTHEGKYWSVQRDLDGQGVSYGILQWTQKGGGLGRVLQRMYDADPAQFRGIFGAGTDTLLAQTLAASLEPIGGALLWEEPWLSRFAQAGHYEPFQRAQDAEAADSDYLRAAIDIATLLGVKTERAMTMYFNRTVHQGAAGAKAPARAMASWYAEDATRRPARPNDVLAQYAWRCASTFRRTDPPANTAYSKDGVLQWKPVKEEYTELRTGDYRVAKVPVASPTWHVFSGGFPVSLYDLITKRSSDILLDPSLRDGDVNLAAVTAKSERPVVAAGITAVQLRQRLNPARWGGVERWGGEERLSAAPPRPMVSGILAAELRRRAA